MNLLSSLLAFTARQIRRLDNRIDDIVSAATVDSEVIDIRNGIDGTHYASAGAAVRGQYTKIQQRVTSLNDARITDNNNRISEISILQTHKVAQPLDSNNQPTNGTSGQSLRTKGDGTTEWAPVGLPTDAQTAQAVSDWLDDHPEATTTVANKSLTIEKFSDSLLQKIQKFYDSVSEMIADENLKQGMCVSTKGYYSSDDGGGSVYYISAQIDTTKWHITLANGLYANMQSEISLKSIGMIEGQNNDTIMSTLIQFIQDNENTRQVSVFVDGYNFQFTTINFANIWNLYLYAIPHGHGHTSVPTPHIVCDSIVFNTAFNCRLSGLNIFSRRSNGECVNSVIKYLGVCRMNFVTQCYIRDGKIGVDIGDTLAQSDTASIVIEDCFFVDNDVAISCNSGNGRVQCRSNFFLSNVRNIDIYGGVNIFEGNVSDCFDYVSDTFEGDVYLYGGGISLIGHDCDCYQGYFVQGTPSLPTTIIGCRHYDSGMTAEKVPFSIKLWGSTTALIDSCYLYNNVIIDVGTNYKATVNACHLLNGSVSGTGRIVSTSSDKDAIAGTFRNRVPVYDKTSMSLDNSYGLLGELTKDNLLSQLVKTQNGLTIVNNAYKTVEGTQQIVEPSLPVSEYSFENQFEVAGYYNSQRVPIINCGLEYDLPYLKLGDRRIYFTNQTYMFLAQAGDIMFTGNTASPFIKVFNGSSWITVI